MGELVSSPGESPALWRNISTDSRKASIVVSARAEDKLWEIP